MPDVFISYSRKDLDFVKEVCGGLKDAGLHVWVDLEGIYVGEEFWPQICAGIEQSDAFCFVMTPRSLTSVYAEREVAHAVSHNKRILPIMREPYLGNIPAALATRQWIFCQDNADLPAAVNKLVEAIRVDAGWVRAHTRLLTRSIEWESAGRNSGFLLRGSDLDAAELWLSQGKGREPAPTTQQSQFISASRKETLRRQRRTITSLVFALVVAMALGTTALVQYRRAEQRRKEAEQKTRRATALQLAAQSKALLATSAQLSVLLAAEALHVTENAHETRVPAAEQALRDALAAHGGIALRAHKEANWLIEISPNGRWAVTGGRDPVAYLYDLSHIDAPPRELRHPVWVLQARFSPDSRWLATGSWGNSSMHADNEVWLWDLNSPDPVAEGKVLRGHAKRVSCFEFSPDGRLAVTGSWDGFVRLWDMTKPDPSVSPVRLPQPEVTAVAFRPDSLMLASGGGGAIRLWDTRHPDTTRFRSLTWKGDDADLFFTPDGKRLLADGEDEVPALFDIANAGPPHLLPAHTDAIGEAMLSPDGRWYLTTGESDSFYVTDLSKPQPEKSTLVKTESRGKVGADFSNDSQWAVTFGRGVHPTVSLHGTFSGEHEQTDHRALLWRLKTRQPFRTPIRLEHESTVRRAVFSPDSKWLVTVTESGIARRWNLRVQKRKLQGSDPQDLSPLELLQKIASMGPGNEAKSQEILDQLAATENDVIPGTGGVGAIAFTPDSRILMVAPVEEPVRFWDFSRTGLAASPLLLGHMSEGIAPRFSPAGRFVALQSALAKIAVMDLACYDPSACSVTVPAQSDEIKSIVLGDRWLATGSEDKTVWITGLSGGKPDGATRVLHGAQWPVSDIQLSADERWLAVLSAGSEAGQDEPVQLYDLQANRPDIPIRLRGQGRLFHARFSPDSRKLVTTSADKTAWIWNLAAADPTAHPEVIHAGTPVLDALFSDTGDRLVLGGWSYDGSGDAHPHVISWANPRQPLHDSEIRTATKRNRLVLSPDGSRVVTVDENNTTNLWNIDSAGNPAPPLKLRDAGGEQNFTALLSRNGRWFVSFGIESQAALWDLSARHPEQTRRTLRTKAGWFSAGAISPDNHWLIMGTSNGEIRIFDLTAPDLEQSSVILAAPGNVDAIAISADSHWFISNSQATLAWRLGIAPLLDLAARTVGRTLTQDERQLYNATLPLAPSAKRP